jgi:hypothetical protein
MTELERVLIRRDEMTPQEAQEYVAELRGRVLEGENPEEILFDELGLEPDYIFDILPY